MLTCECPQCKGSTQLPESALGQQAHCPRCRAVFLLAAPVDSSGPISLLVSRRLWIGGAAVGVCILAVVLTISLAGRPKSELANDNANLAKGPVAVVQLPVKKEAAILQAKKSTDEGTPTEAEARAMYEEICAADPFLQSKVKVLSFKKTDGLATQAFGIKEYQLSFEAELEVLQQVPGFIFDRDAVKGDILRHKGKLSFVNSEKGWAGQEPGDLRDIGKIELFKLASGVVLLQPLDQARSRLVKNLKELVLSMHRFHDSNKRLPAPGFSTDANRPLLSWRVAILPYIRQTELYKQFKLDEAWDSPANSKLLAQMPKVFKAVNPQPQKEGHTYLQLVTGPGTAFPTPTSVAAFKAFWDGTSNTILIVEASESVPWTKPADFHIDVSNNEGFSKGPSITGLGSFSPHRFYAGMADGTVRRFDLRRVSSETLRSAFNPSDGQPLGSDFMLGSDDTADVTDRIDRDAHKIQAVVSEKFEKDKTAFNQMVSEKAKAVKESLSNLWKKTGTSADKASAEKKLIELEKKHENLETRLRDLQEAGEQRFETLKAALTRELEEVERRTAELTKKLEKQKN